MLTNQQIIDEADRLVPNCIDLTRKVLWLNELNKEYFEVVKVWRVLQIPFRAFNGTFVLDAGVRHRNIGSVVFGSEYQDGSRPGASRKIFFFDDESHTLTLSPAPKTGGRGTVIFSRAATTTFSIRNIATDKPDAAPEFHYIYVSGLAGKIAQASGDLEKASQYETEYRNALGEAAANDGVVAG